MGIKPIKDELDDLFILKKAKLNGWLFPCKKFNLLRQIKRLRARRLLVQKKKKEIVIDRK